MNSLGKSNLFSSSTIQENGMKNSHLVLTLRKGYDAESEEIKNKETKITEKKAECENSSSLNSSVIQLFNSSMNNSMISTSPEILPAEITADETETEYLHASNIQELNILIQEKDVHKNLQAAIGTHVDELQPLQDELSYFDLLTTHVSNFVNTHGTQVVSATTTLGFGIASLATGGLFNVVVGASTVAVSANEFWKMLKIYLNEKGGSEHLKALESALNNIENKRKVSSDLIKQAQILNNSVEDGITKIDQKIAFLESQLTNVTGEFSESIKEALHNAENTKKVLLEQQTAINEAIKFSKQAMSVIEKQQDKLTKLIEKMGTTVTKDNYKEVLDDIKQSITEIMADSTEAYDHQAYSNQFMLKAVNLVSEVIKLEEQQMQLIITIQNLEQKLKSAQDSCGEMKAEINNVKKQNQEINNNLHQQKDINKEQKIDIEIAKDALDAEKQTEKFGEASVLIGANLGIVTGFGVGFISFGPPGAIVGVLAAGIFAVSPAVKIAHYSRKILKTNNAVELDSAFQKCAENLSEGKFDSKKGIKMQAKFTYNNMSGASLYKTPWNMVASAVNWYCPDKMSIWGSKRAGNINCQIGGISFPELSFYAHESYNLTFKQYGAISLENQQNLANLLMNAISDDQIDPQDVLKFLKTMESVEVQSAEDNSLTPIMMIHPNSLAMKTLKKLCNKRIKNACPHNEPIDLNK